MDAEGESAAPRQGPAQGLHGQPQRGGARSAHRSARRARERGRAHRADPRAPQEEQPAARRRRRRRQDGDRRGARAQDRRAARCPRRSHGSDRLLARHGRAPRRHALPRRLRGAHQGRHQGAPEDRQGHPLHRRDPHHRRRRRDHAAAAWTRRNLLKPALASGRLRCIGSTTFQEYRQHFEKDRALVAPLPARRGQRAERRGHGEDPRGPAQAVRGVPRRHATRTRRCAPRPSSRRSTSTTASCRTRRSTSSTRRGAAKKLASAVDAACASDVALARAPTVDVADVEPCSRAWRRSRRARCRRATRSGCKTSRATSRRSSSVRTTRSSSSSRPSSCRARGCARPRSPSAPSSSPAPPGVGKTEVAKQLAKVMGVAFHRFDMSEYMEAHTVSRLIGAPPGYVGFDQGGLLTDAIAKTPHAVLLLDEIEKAHPQIFNILLQVMDHGKLTDHNGKQTDFRHVILLMTSNIGVARSAAPRGRLRRRRRRGPGEAGRRPRVQAALQPRVPQPPRREDRSSGRSTPAVMKSIVGKFVQGARRAARRAQGDDRADATRRPTTWRRRATTRTTARVRSRASSRTRSSGRSATSCCSARSRTAATWSIDVGRRRRTEKLVFRYSAKARSAELAARIRTQGRRARRRSSAMMCVSCAP